MLAITRESEREPRGNYHQPVMKSSPEKKVIVTIPAVDKTVRLTLGKNQTGRDLLDALVDRLGIVDDDKQWLGIMFTDQKGQRSWLSDVDTPVDEAKEYFLIVRLFPVDLEAQVRQEETLYMMYRQVQLCLVRDTYRINYPLDGLLRLASYAVHVDLVGIDGGNHLPKHVGEYLPARLIQEMGEEQAEERLIKLHAELTARLDPTDAMKEFLNAANGLNVWGLQSVFQVTGSDRDDRLLLGIGPIGLTVYQPLPTDPIEHAMARNYEWDQVADCKCPGDRLEIILHRTSRANRSKMNFRVKPTDREEIVALTGHYTKEV